MSALGESHAVEASPVGGTIARVVWCTGSRDGRYLGVAVNLTATVDPAGTVASSSR